jgi:hypothetical protein
MPASTWWPSALSAAALALTACGSCSGGDGSGGDAHAEVKEMSVTRACGAFAGAECKQLFACNPFTGSVVYGDEATCQQRATLACMPAIGAAGSTLTPSQVDQCAQAVTAETCEQYLDNDQPSACTYTGSRPAGAACGTDAQCQSGYCRLAPIGMCGTCGMRAQAGQPLAEGGIISCLTDNDCSATLLCALGQCVAPAASGAACGPLQPCQRTLACVGGKCGAPVPLGGICTTPTDCDGTHGAYCNPVTKTCQTIATAVAGQPCGILDAGVTNCTGGSTCGNVKLLVGTCHQPAADNSPCGPDIGCMAPALCSTSARCTLPTPAVCN